MNLIEDKIEEVAELLICGDLCFINIKTGEIENFPYKSEFNNEEDPWQDTKDRIIQEFDNYVKCEPLDKDEYFKIIELFIDSIGNENRKARFKKALTKPKPYIHFNDLIDSYSDLKKEWTEFRLNKYKERVSNKLRNANGSS